MRLIHIVILAMSVSGALGYVPIDCSTASAAEPVLIFNFDKVPPLPDPEGFAGMFAGVSNGVLIAAGGTNFREKRVWEGGKKVWYDQIFIFDPRQKEWQISSAKLPRRLAYGVSATWNNTLICVGGADPDHASADVFGMTWVNGAIRITPLPSLPTPCATPSGAVVDDVLYIAGGLPAMNSPKANHTFWAMDLRAPAERRRWIELDPWPGVERHDAVAASAGGCFWLMTGVTLKANDQGLPERITPLLTDLYCFKPNRNGELMSGTWSKRSPMPRAALASPTPAPLLDESHFVIIGGGDDQENALADPAHHPGYNLEVLSYDITADRWQKIGELPPKTPQVDAPATPFSGGWVVVSGEVGPSIRTNRSLFLQFRPPEAENTTGNETK